MAKNIGALSLGYFVRKECNEEGRYYFLHDYGALVFRCAKFDGKLCFSWKHYDNPGRYGEVAYNWWSGDAFDHWLSVHYHEVSRNGYLVKTDDNPMTSFHYNDDATNRRVEISREILGVEKWNALEAEEKAGALMYIYSRGEEEARKEGRYDGSTKLEDFLDDRNFFAWSGVENLVDLGKEELEMTEALDNVFADKDNELNECFDFNYATYAACLTTKIEWGYFELYNDDGAEVFRGIVWWYEGQNNR